MVGFWCWVAVVLGLLVPLPVGAEPRGRILNVAAPQGPADEPVLTTLIDLADTRSVATTAEICRRLPLADRLECLSQRLSLPFELFTPYPFPQQNVRLTAKSEGVTESLRFVSEQLLEASDDARAGTAWLVLLDVDSRMGKAREDARLVLDQLLEKLAPHDTIDLMLLGEREVVGDSSWHEAPDLSAVRKLLELPVARAEGQNRELAGLILAAASDGFAALDARPLAPLHRALVVLSNGYGGRDTITTGSAARELSRRFSEGAAPVSIASVYFPRVGVKDEAALEFMQGLANPSVGGYFGVAGEKWRTIGIPHLLRRRFGHMHVVKWRTACLRPGKRDLELSFVDTKPELAGDEVRNVSISESALPLVIDRKLLPSAVEGGGSVRAGGNLTVYVELCESRERQDFRVYFDPGDEVLASDPSIERWRARGIAGVVREITDRSVSFDVPASELVVVGSRTDAKVRFVLWDEQAQRASPVIELPAEQPTRLEPAPRNASDVSPYCPRCQERSVVGPQVSLLLGMGSAFGPKQAADEDLLELSGAVRASYVLPQRLTLSMRGVQSFDDGALATTRGQLEGGWSFQLRGRGKVALFEPYVGLGAAKVRRLESEAQFVSALGLQCSISLLQQPTLLGTVGLEGLFVLPESQGALTGFVGFGLAP